MRIRDWFARAAEVRELRDTVVEQAAELAALRALTQPDPVDWTALTLSLEAAEGWLDTDDLAAQARSDQALASWRDSFRAIGIDVDDEHDLRTSVAALVAAGGSSQGFACHRARSPFAQVALHDHTIGFLQNAVLTLLQFRPKETT